MRLNLTQSELANLAGVSLRAVRNIELGHVRHPHGTSVRRLNAALGLEEPRPLQVRILGPLDVTGQIGSVPIGSTKVRSLLALLALQANKVVSRSEIADVLWGADLPKTHVNLVHTYIARLRRILATAGDPARPEEIIAGTPGGYVLLADAERLDVLRALELADRARAQAGSGGNPGVDLLAEALDLWRGPALVDLPSAVRMHPVAVGLHGKRLAIAMAYAAAAFRLGRYAPVVERLRAVSYDEPLHEGLNAELMLALAGSGQRAAAIRLFVDVKQRLAEELGVAPGAAMREAHLQIIKG